MPRRSRRSNSRSSTVSEVRESSAPVGSSASSSRGSVGERARDRHALALAAGELGRAGARRGRRARPPRAAPARARAARGGACPRRSAALRRSRGPRASPAAGGAGRRSRRARDARGRDAARVQIARPSISTRPRVGLLEPADQRQQRALAGARTPGDRDRLARLDAQRDVAQRADAAEALAHILDGRTSRTPCPACSRRDLDGIVEVDRTPAGDDHGAERQRVADRASTGHRKTSAKWPVKV